MMPLLRESLAETEAEVGLETSFMPSGPRGIDSLPPMFPAVNFSSSKIGRDQATNGVG